MATLWNINGKYAMSGIELYLVDTNIFIHLFNGNINAETTLKGKILHFSYITEIELLGFTGISLKLLN